MDHPVLEVCATHAAVVADLILVHPLPHGVTHSQLAFLRQSTALIISVFCIYLLMALLGSRS